MGRPSKNSVPKVLPGKVLNPYALSGAFLAFLQKAGWIEIQITEQKGIKYLLTEEGKVALSSNPYNFEISKLIESGIDSQPKVPQEFTHY